MVSLGRDFGALRGMHTALGGRLAIRKTLYMATLSAAPQHGHQELLRAPRGDGQAEEGGAHGRRMRKLLAVVVGAVPGNRAPWAAGRLASGAT